MTTTRSVYLLIGSLFAVGVAGGVLAAGDTAPLWLLLPLGFALIVAGSLQVEFQYGKEVRAIDLFESVLAPVVLTFAGPFAVGLAAAAKAVSQYRLGVAPTKAAFNVAQWSAAMAVASVVYRNLALDDAGTASSVVPLAIALLACALVNEFAMAAVLRLVRRESMYRVLRELAPDYPPHALIWSMTAALGLLFAVSVASVPATAILVLAPLTFLHWGHQAFLSMRADRARLDGLSHAVATLAAPIDPREALPEFCDDVREAFSSTILELVLFDPPTVLRSGVSDCPTGHALTLARLLGTSENVCRAEATAANGELAAALLAAGRRQALAAPLLRDGEVVGVLASYDRIGFQGFEEGEEAVIVALASAVGRALEKSELLGVVVEERRKLGEIVDRSSDGILTIGLGGIVESWNPAMQQITGYSEAEMTGRTTLARLGARDTENNDVSLGAWTDTPIPSEVKITTATGEERWLGCSSAVAAGGDTLVVVARDITRAREIDRMKDDFIATVSHELRTPLTTIRGFTHMLLEPPGEITEELRTEALGRIRKGTHRLERLVANLLEVTRIEARRSVSVIPTELDLSDVAARIVDEVQESWPDRAIMIDAGDTEWRATGSLLSVERILINLLSNALTYAPSGPVVLHIGPHESGAGIAVSVRDSGPGIPLHEQARVFERFERLDTSSQQAGTGLGLYIARGLATNMGAELTLKSEPGHGAEFTLRLPNARTRPALVDLTA